MSDAALPLKVFISYSHKDESYKDELRDHLSALVQEGKVELWHDRDIEAGTEWDAQIAAKLDAAEIVLLLVSPSFMASPYIRSQELSRAKEHHQAGTARVIPIILRPVDFKGTLIEDLQALPKNAKPITRWDDRDEAYLDAVQGIRRVVEKGQDAGLSATSLLHNLPRSGAVAFVGRQLALEQLQLLLSQSQEVAITALRGMGGIGKSELALQYALASLREGRYPGGIGWFEVRGLDVGVQIVEFAQARLGLSVPDSLETLKSKVDYCWQHWPAADPDRPALVVFDDVTDYAALQPYLPPPEPRFQVVLTTREYLGKSVRTLELGVLEESDALELLRELTTPERIDAELEQAKALCYWLGYLPLALELVGRYLASRDSLSLSDMQQRLESKKLAARALIDTEGDMIAKLGVAAAFELSLERLEEETQQLAYTLSLFAIAPLPWELVQWCWPEANAEDLEDWRVQLENGSLLQSRGGDTYQLHPLIREFLQARFGEAAWADGIKRSYCKAMVQVAQQIPASPTQKLILGVAVAMPHLVEAATTWQTWLEDEDLTRTFTGLGWFYKGQGLYEQAAPWLADCLAATRQRFGSEHPDVATSLNNLAYLYKTQGRYELAEPLLQQALEMRRSLLGEQHPDVAFSLNSLAALYRAQGRYELAEPLYEQALALYRSLPGKQHLNVALSLNNLAELYRAQGRYVLAEPLLQQALALRRSQLGEQHLDVADSLLNLGALRYNQQRYAEAKALLQQALPIYQQAFGPEHSNTKNLLSWIEAVQSALDRAAD